MASLTKNYSQEKLFGQVYTPFFVVEKILDNVGFNSPDQLGKTILDPACGDGRFLIKIVERIIEWSEIADLEKNLSNVYGWDIDEKAVFECIKNLNELIDEYEFEFNWNIRCLDSLDKISLIDLFQSNEAAQKFNFIVGNPPYIRIQHLNEHQRRFIKANFSFCQSGSTDIFIAFFELANHLLNQDGICGFISPNSWATTETGKALRDHFQKTRTLIQLTNYCEIQLFEKASTYCAISIFGKHSNSSFLYEEAFTKADFFERNIPFEELETENFWQLSTDAPISFDGIKLKDFCQIHVGITTLSDKAYFFQASRIDAHFFTAHTKFGGDVKIEADILRPIIKASTLKCGDEPIREYALFPYKKINGKHVLLSENELKNDFPLAFAYLTSIKSELSKRDNGQPVAPAWFAFGRSQGLDTSFGRKILFSPMGKKPLFIVSENAEATFYSGYCIKWDGDLEWLAAQLNSERMQKFIAISSRDFRGGWKAYNKKIVQEFAVEWPPNSKNG